MWSCLLGCLVTLGVTDGLADTWGPIDVEVDVGRLAVSHEETLQRDQAAMAVRNAEARPVDCTVVFRNGPELPVSRQAVIEAGGERLFNAPIRRAVTRLNISLVCQPAE